MGWFCFVLDEVFLNMIGSFSALVEVGWLVLFCLGAFLVGNKWYSMSCKASLCFWLGCVCLRVFLGISYFKGW